MARTALKRLENVFPCCSVCETMEDYKEEYLMVWANYLSPCNSIAGLFFKGTCDFISVAKTTHIKGPQKRPLNFSFSKLSEKRILCWKVP